MSPPNFRGYGLKGSLYLSMVLVLFLVAAFLLLSFQTPFLTHPGHPLLSTKVASMLGSNYLCCLAYLFFLHNNFVRFDYPKNLLRLFFRNSLTKITSKGYISSTP